MRCFSISCANGFSRGRTGLAGVLLALALLCAGYLTWPGGTEAAGVGPARLDDDGVCARCHESIYARYEQTTKARGSGLAADGLITGGFRHAASGVDYRVTVRDGVPTLAYARTGGEALAGELRLGYFVGSGRRGRTYLYARDGLWFEAPINFYGKKAIWDMAPNFESAKTLPDALPVDPNCLHCHASEVGASVGGARNRFAGGVPFAQGGVGCAACHGEAAAHVASGGKAAVVNPAKLAAAARDSVCLQCHLEGDAAIYKAGRSLAAFRPGEDLSDSVVYFVKAGAEGGGGRAASQWEALLRSRCKVASGDKLTCTTCHDPHGEPTEAERVAYFRGKCLGCHQGRGFAVEHHPEQQDCALCHMPTRVTTDISHEQTTDHDIVRRPGPGGVRPVAWTEATTLVPVGGVRAGDRELGLAYAQMGQGGNVEAGARALALLGAAERAGADDAELHTQLGLIEQLAGRAGAAQAEYLRALARDPGEATALGNLAVLEAGSGHAAEAVERLAQVVRENPAEMAAGLNLAFIECRVGRRAEARAELEELRRFSPDDARLRGFLERGVYAGARCDVGTGGGSGGR